MKTIRYIENIMMKYYKNLNEDSPKSITINVPKDYGVGIVEQIKSKNNIVVSKWKMEYKTDVNVSGLSKEDLINIIFCFEGPISWKGFSEKQEHSIGKGEVCIYKGKGNQEFITYSSNTKFNFQNIKVPVEFLNKILKSYFNKQELRIFQNKIYNEISNINITPYMQHILKEMNDIDLYRGNLGHLFLETKVIEIITVIFSEILEIKIRESTNYQLSKMDINTLLYVKELLDSSIADVPSITELAKIAHMSESKLTKSFSNMFGQSIHSYVLDQRLKKAACLLLDGKLTISQISDHIGYSKHSNFSKAFKKKFGVLPKEYKKSREI